MITMMLTALAGGFGAAARFALDTASSPASATAGSG